MGGPNNAGQSVIKNAFISIIVFLLFAVSYAFYRIKLFPLVPERLQPELKKYVTTICIIWVAYIIQRIIGTVLSWYGKNIVSKTKSQLDDKLIPLLRKTLKVGIWIMAFIVILPFYGVNISALIATLGVGSLAVALAAQDTIANIISGFLIMVDTPFRIGDKIKLPSGEVVEVLDVGIRRSKFLSEDKASVIIVPNLDLSKSKIINYTYVKEI